MARIVKIDPADPDPAIEEAAAVLKAGGLVAYPTESFYALGADALSPEAVQRVFAVKGREEGKPLLVILHDKLEIPKYAVNLSDAAKAAVEGLMPGPITLIFQASGLIPEALTSGTGRVGIRVPEHGVCTGLARALGGPVTATSANVSGAPGPVTAAEVEESLGVGIDLILDGGKTPGPPPSTLLDVASDPPLLLREGRVSRLKIELKVGGITP